MIKIRTKTSFYKADISSQLVVLLHRYRQTNLSMQHVAALVRKEFPQADIYAPSLPAGLVSCADPQQIAEEIVDDISNLRHIDSYEKIILVGHSMGAVLVRKIWALAHGALPDATVQKTEARWWAHKIERIILLAAVNRGWMVSSAQEPTTRLLWTLGMAWGHFCRYILRKEPLILNFRRGAPFLTVVRLQCLAVERGLDKRPVTVQLIGTDDNFVAPTDNLDLATGKNFYYLEVANATHEGVVELTDAGDPHGAYQRFRSALMDDDESLKEKSLAPEDVFDGVDEIDDFESGTLPEKNLEVKHVVFVIHGIRDRGFWTRRIARKIRSAANAKGERCRAVTSTYGFFPMGPFLLPWVRRGKVEWLLDQYVTAKSLYPEARFSYVGHSNGTYLLAKALELCRPLVFEEGVVFAGSVVRRNFEWEKYVPHRVSRMINYVASADWVVAIFPYGLERLRLQDVGGAGHVGFTYEKKGKVTNVHYAKGSHSAALAPDRWQEMADFVLEGHKPTNPIPGVEQDTLNVWRGRLAPVILIVITVIVLGFAALMLAAIGKLGGIWALATTLAFCLYLYLLRVVLTRA
jgi:pimeloyl-ACP methyl ester carboxylesterase